MKVILASGEQKKKKKLSKYNCKHKKQKVKYNIQKNKKRIRQKVHLNTVLHRKLHVKHHKAHELSNLKLVLLIFKYNDYIFHIEINIVGSSNLQKSLCSTWSI